MPRLVGASHPDYAGDVSNPARAYWRTNIRYVLVLLAIWFAVSYGCGILFVDLLNQYRIGQAKLGFWFAQQGSIYAFIVLILVYVLLMSRLDRRFGFREE